MFWNRITVLKLIATSRVLVAQAKRGRTFVKVDPALFDRFRTALEKVSEQQPIGMREIAKSIVDDFLLADRTDDEAQATLTDWITDAIYFATLDLAEAVENLRHAAQRVVDSWSSGDLAGAVRDLDALLRLDETEGGS